MISTLLAGLIIFLSLHAVDSLSPSRRSEPQLFTLPIRPIPRPSNIHPQILLQMDINRGIRRLAKMTGAAPPSDRSLQQRIAKRILSLDVPSGIDKRLNRLGIHNVGDVRLEKRFNQVGVLNPRRMGTRQSIEAPEPPTAANSLGLAIENVDTGYLAVIQIGTPPRDFTILVDSGSADFWVGGESCFEEPSGNGCGDHTFLGQESSSSFRDLSMPFKITYGTGAVSGSMIRDNVFIAGLKLRRHKFGVANQESTDFTIGSLFDGIMGLAESSLSEQRTPTPIEALAAAGLVEANITSYKLGRLGDGKNNGEITFGALDATKFKPNTLVILPNINVQGFWECNMDAVIVNGRNLKLFRRTAILDTGTTLVLAPTNDSELLHKHIPGAYPDNSGGFILPCNTNIVVALIFDGRIFNIDPQDIVRGPVKVKKFTDGTFCASGIAGTDSLLKNQWLVGDTFLKNAYYSTQIGKNGNSTISLAELV